MRRGGWFLSVLLVLLLLGGAAWIVRGTDSPRVVASSEASSDDAPDVAKPRAVRKPAALDAQAADADIASTAVPPPVDLDAVDRDRDLHGVVVRRDGTPVAGAEVVAVSYPWRRADFLTGDYDASVDGPRTRSSADGTFALRLRRGARVSLRVAAEGFPEIRVPGRQAGERVRIVLDAGVRLRLTVVDELNHLMPGLKFKAWTAGRSTENVARREFTTGPDGDAVLDGLPAGSRMYVELLTNGPGNPSWVEVRLGESGETTERIELPTGRTLRGRVVDDATDAPVAKARVGMNWVLDLAVETDADGRYELPGWTAKGMDDIHVLATGYARASVVVGTESQLDFRLRRGFEATGRVVDGDARPVRGALVELVASAFVHGDQRTSSGDAVSDADGRFRVGGLDPELPHMLVVVADGFGRLRRPAPRLADAWTVDLGDVALPTARVVAGRVVDAAGKPMPRAPVSIEGPTERTHDSNGYGNEEEEFTDDLGRFAFSDLASGKYRVRVDVDGAPPVEATVDLPSDHDVDDVTIRAAASTAVEVRVVDERGGPVAGAWAHAEIDGGGRVDGWTDARGVARLQIPSDPAEISVFFVGESRRFRECEPQKWKQGTAAVTFVAREGSRVDGTVVDAEGKAVAKALLRLVTDDAADDWGVADDSGRFDWVVAPGAKFRLVFEGVTEGDETGLVGEVDCTAESKDVVLRCTRVAVDRTLSVKATTPGGEPAAGVVVSVGRPSWRAPRTATTDEHGVARFEGLPHREVLIAVVAAGEFAQSAEAKAVPEGQQVVVAQRRAAEIRGSVVGADGKPASAGVAAAVDRHEMGAARTDADGRFVLRVPADVPGPFRVTANGAEGEGAASSVAAGATDVRIVLAK